MGCINSVPTRNPNEFDAVVTTETSAGSYEHTSRSIATESHV